METKIRKRLFRSLFTICFLGLMLLPSSMPFKDRLKLRQALKHATDLTLYEVESKDGWDSYHSLDQVEILTQRTLEPPAIKELTGVFSWFKAFQWSIARNCHKPESVIALAQPKGPPLLVFISFECNSMQLAGSAAHGIPMTWDLEGFVRVYRVTATPKPMVGEADQAD